MNNDSIANSNKMAANPKNDDRTWLTAATWWSVDLSRRPRFKVGATPLVERCMRAHEWSEEFAMLVLDGYRKFLTLKQMLKGQSTEQISPSIPVENMWHLHILDTANYGKDCQLLFGRMIHHDPDECLFDQTRKKRIEKTKFALRLKCNEEYNLQVWNNGIGATIVERPAQGARLSSLQSTAVTRTNEERRPKRPRTSESTDSHAINPPLVQSRSEAGGGARGASSGGRGQGPPTATTSGETLTIRVRNNQGEDKYFTLKETTPMEIVFQIMSNEMGEPAYNLRFLIDGDRIDANDTPRSLGLKEDDVIDLMYELRS